MAGIERRKVYAKQGSLPNIPQYYIKINNQAYPLQDMYNRNGYPLCTDDNGISYYTVINGRRVELEGHPYARSNQRNYR